MSDVVRPPLIEAFERPTPDPVWALAFKLALGVNSSWDDAEDAANYARDGVTKQQGQDSGFPASAKDLERFIQALVSRWFDMKWETAATHLSYDSRIAYEMETHPSVWMDPEVTEESLSDAEREAARIHAERLQGVNTALARLSPQRRELFLNRYLHALRTAAIAGEKGLKPATVSTNNWETMRAIRDELGVVIVKNRQEVP